MDLDYYEKNNHPFIRDMVNAASLVCACIVLISITIIAIRGYRLVNRVTFRIQAGIAAADLIRHLHLILLFHLTEDSLLCVPSPLLYYFFTNVFILLNVAVALNLHLVILLGMRPNPRWQKRYWIGSFSLAAISSVILLANGFFGADGDGLCDYRWNMNDFFYWKMPFKIMPIAASMFYTLAVTIVLMYKLHKSAPKIVDERNSDNINDPIEAAILLREVRSIVYKVGLYPAAFFVSLSGYTLYSLYALFAEEENVPLILILWSSFSLRSAGILNLIAFASDLSFNTGIYLISKPESYEFDQPYRKDMMSDNPTHAFNINPKDLDDPTSRLIQFRPQDRHLGDMRLSEFKKFL